MIRREILNKYGRKIVVSENNDNEHPYCVEINDDGNIGVIELNEKQLLILSQTLSDFTYNIVGGKQQ